MALATIKITNPTHAELLRRFVQTVLSGRLGPLTFTQPVTVTLRRSRKCLSLCLTSGDVEIWGVLNPTQQLPIVGQILSGAVSRLRIGDKVTFTIQRRPDGRRADVDISGRLEVSLPGLPDPDILGAMITPDYILIDSRLAAIRVQWTDATRKSEMADLKSLAASRPTAFGRAALLRPTRKLTDEDAESAVAAVASACSSHPLMKQREARWRTRQAEFAAGRIRDLINQGVIRMETPTENAVGMVGFGWLAMLLWKPLLTWIVQRIIDHYFDALEQP